MGLVLTGEGMRTHRPPRGCGTTWSGCHHPPPAMPVRDPAGDDRRGGCGNRRDARCGLSVHARTTCAGTVSVSIPLVALARPGCCGGTVKLLTRPVSVGAAPRPWTVPSESTTRSRDGVRAAGRVEGSPEPSCKRARRGSAVPRTVAPAGERMSNFLRSARAAQQRRARTRHA